MLGADWTSDQPHTPILDSSVTGHSHHSHNHYRSGLTTLGWHSRSASTSIRVGGAGGLDPSLSYDQSIRGTDLYRSDR
jgi:hypothetical protein